MLKKHRDEYLRNHLLFLKKIESTYHSDNPTNNYKEHKGIKSMDIKSSNLDNRTINIAAMRESNAENVKLQSQGSHKKILLLWNDVVLNEDLLKSESIRNIEDTKIHHHSKKYPELTGRLNFLSSPKKVQSERIKFTKEMNKIIEKNNKYDSDRLLHLPLFAPKDVNKHKVNKLSELNSEKDKRLPNIEMGTNLNWNKNLNYGTENINTTHSRILSANKSPNKIRNNFTQLNIEVEKSLMFRPIRSPSPPICSKHGNHEDKSPSPLRSTFRARDIPTFEVRDNVEINKRILDRKLEKVEKTKFLESISPKKSSKQVSKANIFDDNPIVIEKLSMNDVYNSTEPEPKIDITDLKLTKVNYDKIVREDNIKNLKIHQPLAVDIHQNKLKNYFNSTKFKHHKYDVKLSERKIDELRRKESHMLFIEKQKQNKAIFNKPNKNKYANKDNPGFGDISKLSIIHPMNKTIRINNESFYDNLDMLKSTLIA